MVINLSIYIFSIEMKNLTIYELKKLPKKLDDFTIVNICYIYYHAYDFIAILQKCIGKIPCIRLNLTDCHHTYELLPVCMALRKLKDENVYISLRNDHKLIEYCFEMLADKNIVINSINIHSCKVRLNVPKVIPTDEDYTVFNPIDRRNSDSVIFDNIYLYGRYPDLYSGRPQLYRALKLAKYVESKKLIIDVKPCHVMDFLDAMSWKMKLTEMTIVELDECHMISDILQMVEEFDCLLKLYKPSENVVKELHKQTTNAKIEFI